MCVHTRVWLYSNLHISVVCVRVCAYACVVVFQCTHWCGVCTCVRVSVCGCIPMYTLVWCVCTCVCVHTRVWLYSNVHISVVCVYVCVHTRVWLYSNVHIGVVCVCVRVCAYACVVAFQCTHLCGAYLCHYLQVLAGQLAAAPESPRLLRTPKPPSSSALLVGVAGLTNQAPRQ